MRGLEIAWKNPCGEQDRLDGCGVAWGCWVSQGCPGMLSIHGMPEHHRDTQECWLLFPSPTLDGHDSLFSHDPGGDVVGESLSSLHTGWWLPGLWAL